MRARVLAAIALRGMLEAWAAWFEKHATDADFQLSEALEAKAVYVLAALEHGLRSSARLRARQTSSRFGRFKRLVRSSKRPGNRRRRCSGGQPLEGGPGCR